MVLKVYIGFDAREKVAYDVCKKSISYGTHKDVSIIPLVHKQLRKQGWFSRPWMVNAYDGNSTDLIDGRPFSTEFSHTRFLVPALMHYNGWALFMDCDMVFDSDIKDLFALCDDRYAVMCVKHRHKPTEMVKMDGCQQTSYHRKNWSSFVLFNCAHPANKVLTPDVVNTKSGTWLHGFEWLQDHEIGELPTTYNWIEGISQSNIKPDVIHYTLGGPWFENYKDVVHADVWWKYYDRWLADDCYEPMKQSLNVDYGVRK